MARYSLALWASWSVFMWSTALWAGLESWTFDLGTPIRTGRHRLPDSQHGIVEHIKLLVSTSLNWHKSRLPTDCDPETVSSRPAFSRHVQDFPAVVLRCYCSRGRATNGMCESRADFDQAAGRFRWDQTRFVLHQLLTERPGLF